MDRKLCAEIFYFLLSKNFKKGDEKDEYHLTQKVVTSFGLVSQINISFKKKVLDFGDNSNNFSMYMTDSYAGNYFVFKSLDQFKIWFECLDIKEEYIKKKTNKKQSVVYVAPYGYFHS